jgi:hypothetical protein
MRHIAKYFPNNLDWCGDEIIPSISMDSRLTAPTQPECPYVGRGGNTLVSRISNISNSY